MIFAAMMISFQQVAGAPSVLYDCTTSAASAEQITALGAVKYRWFGQALDPDSQATGRIDLSKLATAVTEAWGPNPSGWGMLDFEVPFDDWIDLPPNDPRHKQAIAELTQAVTSMKRVFPGVKWTCYGIPRLSRWPRDEDGLVKGWSEVSGSVRSREIGRRSRELADLVASMDWVSPSLYDVYENGLFTPNQCVTMRANEDLWRTDIVRLSKDILRSRDRASVPVIPCVSPLFQPGGKATVQSVIAEPEFLQDQIAPAIAGGADGFALWSAVDYAMRISTQPGQAALDKDSAGIRDASRKAWRALVPSPNGQIDWESDEVRLRISAELGSAVFRAAVAGHEAVRRARTSADK